MKKDQKAPDFILNDQDGHTHSLSEYKGQKIVLYFYPKDMTSGCTLEAQGFRDLWLEYTALGVLVFGISPDNEASHRKFCEKESITFPLFSDIDHAVAMKYGVWKEKSMYGKKYMGVQRDTFLIDEEGVIIAHFEKVNPTDHPKELLDYIKKLS